MRVMTVFDNLANYLQHKSTPSNDRIADFIISQNHFAIIHIFLRVNFYPY